MTPGGWVRVGGALVLAGCGISPVSRRVAVGQETYVVFAGEGADGATDLFVGPGAGGAAYRLTFTSAPERLPALAPNGVAVAFLRTLPGAEELVVMNLLTGAERARRLSGEIGAIERLAWDARGERIILRAATGRWGTLAPPRELAIRRLADDARAAADSALTIWLGAPPFARVVDCETGDVPVETGRTLCTEERDGRRTLLVAGAEDPMRWGDDSVAYRQGTAVIVRPIGGGRLRTLEWTPPITGLREVTVFVPPVPAGSPSTRR